MKRPVVIALLALCGLSCGCRDRFDVPDTPADAPAANITIAGVTACCGWLAARDDPHTCRLPAIDCLTA